MWQTNLIRLYCAVCDNSSIIEAVMQRQSNNFRLKFSDEECITIYLRGISQRRFEQKAIYQYTKNHLLEWFPKLPRYQEFSRRLNLLAPVFQALSDLWLDVVILHSNNEGNYIEDTIHSGDAFSTFVSSIRQPIECFFNWLNRLTNIQTASIVRSTTGLLLHIFGRIAAALATLIFNS